MSFASLTPRHRVVLAAIWVGGSVALVGTVLYALLFTTAYHASWAWISFIGMVALEDVVAGCGRLAWGWRLPRLTLMAAIIVFRKHPDVVVLVALAAAPLASLVLRQAWFTLLGKTSSWVLAAGLGWTALKAIGFGDTAHFVLATAALLCVYASLDVVLQQALEDPVALDWQPVATQWVGTAALGIGGALVALGWRTPAVGPTMLRLGELSVLAMAGMLIGFALGGTARGFSTGVGVRRRVSLTASAGLALLAISTQSQGVVSALIAVGGLLAIGTWVVHRRAYYAVLLIAGGLANEVVRLANGGKMPVDITGLPPDSQLDLTNLARHSSAYRLAGPDTRLPWLDDRFPVPIFPGIASLGDVMVATGIICMAAALTLANPRVTGRPTAQIEQTAA